MADKLQSLILEGLAQAVADPEGLPLFRSRQQRGIFPPTRPARQAAQQCKDARYLRTVSTQTKGKSTLEICAVTDEGLAFLLSHTSAKPVLEQFIRAIDDRGRQMEELIQTAQKCRRTLESLQRQLTSVLELGTAASPQRPPAAVHSANGTNGSASHPPPQLALHVDWEEDVFGFLSEWQALRPNEDCTLPELYRHVARRTAGLTIGQFHDGLRRLHDQARIYLHPWTGPLYELPDPACAMLVGHVVAYYASLHG